MSQVYYHHNNLPNEYFTREEAEKLKAKLADLEAALTDNQRKNNEDKAQMENAISSIHLDIQVLTENVGGLTKQGWFKSYLARALNWTKDPSNRKLLKDGGSPAVGLLKEAGEFFKDPPTQ